MPRERREGRIANVSAALLIGGSPAPDAADVSRLAVLLDRFFEEVLLVGGDAANAGVGRRVADIEGPEGPLRGIASALAAASAARVLVVAGDQADVPPELLLALIAWPEHDAVVPRASEAQPPCALYRREPALKAARDQLAAGALDVWDWLDTLDVDFIEGENLTRVTG